MLKNDIVSNMESVIKSVTKKYKKSKKKRVDLIDVEPGINDISRSLSSSLVIANEDKPINEVDNTKLNYKKNFISNKRNSIASEGNLPEVDLNKSLEISNCAENNENCDKEPSKVFDENAKSTSPLKNAFFVMMSARNKSIGSNSPGKNLEEINEISPSKLVSTIKTDRKLFLESWANKKGGTKRKLQEEAQEEYIKIQMSKRKKRLKKLLKNSTVSESEDEYLTKNDVLKGKKSIKKKSKHPNSESNENQNENYDNCKPKSKTSSKKVENNNNSEKKGIKSVSVESICDSENEFLNKLSSPLKKRENLLGYFNKIVTQSGTSCKTYLEDQLNINTENIILDIDDSCSKNIVLNEKNQVEVLLIESPNQRPKRSCTGKRYIYDISPEKISGKKSLKRAKKLSNSPNQEPSTSEKGNNCKKKMDQIIDVDDLSWSPKKLAPLFIKEIAKPIIDSTIIVARKEFLNSGIPEKLKIEIEKQKVYEESIKINIFPKISHINQYDIENDLQLSEIDILNFPIKFKLTIIDDFIIELKKNSLRFGYFTDCSTTKNIFINSSFKSKNYIRNIQIDDIKNIKPLVQALKQSYDNFPIIRCFKQLNNKKKEHTLNCQPSDKNGKESNFYEEINNLDKSIEIIENHCNNSDNQLFTEIYKPTELNQFLVNSSPILTLKKFLSNWKNTTNNSFLDFSLNNDSDSNTIFSSISNSIVLLGPSGCGKTNAVYALANEMNFKVLEINCGSKRTGKKILQELHEATQSHNMHSKCDKINIKKNELFKHNNKIVDDSSNDYVLNEENKLALILIEDADVVFEQDDGFIHAINQLAGTSKRPVILISNNSNSPHLLKFISQNCIIFEKPKTKPISMWLSIMSLVENIYFDPDEIAKLYIYNDRNLRKTILDLQFFIKTGGDRRDAHKLQNKTKHSSRTVKNAIEFKKGDKKSNLHYVQNNNVESELFVKHKKLLSLFSTNQNYNNIIQYPVNFNVLWYNVPIILNLTPGNNAKVRNKKLLNDFNQIHDFYDNITYALVLQNREIHDRIENHLNEEISHYLVENSIKQSQKNFNNNIDIEYNALMGLHTTERNHLSKYLPSTSKNAKCMDYDPYLRSICRIEKNRENIDRKSSRFYHYLRNFITNDSFNSSFFNQFSTIFEDI